VENGHDRMGLGDEDSYFWKTSKEREEVEPLNEDPIDTYHSQDGRYEDVQ